MVNATTAPAADSNVVDAANNSIFAIIGISTHGHFYHHHWPLGNPSPQLTHQEMPSSHPHPSHPNITQQSAKKRGRKQGKLRRFTIVFLHHGCDLCRRRRCLLLPPFPPPKRPQNTAGARWAQSITNCAHPCCSPL